MSQGALAVECRYNDQRVIRLLEKLNHKDTVLSVIAERAFMRRLVSKIFPNNTKRLSDWNLSPSKVIIITKVNYLHYPNKEGICNILNHWKKENLNF